MEKTRSYRAVLFDLDGTLLDTLGDLHAAVNVALEAEGFPLKTRNEVRSLIGNGIRRTIEGAVPPDTDPETVDRTLAVFGQAYRAHLLDRTVPYEGIPELLRDLKAAGIRTAVVTNKFDEGACRLIATLLPGLSDMTLGERKDLPRKPAPDMPMYVLKELGVSSDECLYVGDSPVDVCTADNAGLRGAFVTWGYASAEDLVKAGAEMLCRDAAELRRACGLAE